MKGKDGLSLSALFSRLLRQRPFNHHIWLCWCLYAAFFHISVGITELLFPRWVCLYKIFTSPQSQNSLVSWVSRIYCDMHFVTSVFNVIPLQLMVGCHTLFRYFPRPLCVHHLFLRKMRAERNIRFRLRDARAIYCHQVFRQPSLFKLRFGHENKT